MSLPEVPPPDEVTAAWWEATTRHELTLQTCPDCGVRQHPPRAVCMHCGRLGGLLHEHVTGSAAVDSFTIVHRAPRTDVEVPYVIARVRVADVLLLTRLVDREPDAWSIGDRVEVRWIDLPDGRALPVFAPAEATTPDHP